jgi:predicted benzoate:H+ symporter BenE
MNENIKLIILTILLVVAQLYFCGIGAFIGSVIGGACLFLLIYLRKYND